jgi:serine/threonine-protein kinase/endoribonuclease IRE1
MSPERYPLVIFGGGERYGLEGDAKRGVAGGKGRQKALDPPTIRGDREEEDGDSDACLVNPYDVRCLIGVRPLEEGDGIEGRMRRLLDGPKTAASSSSSSSSSWSSSMPAGQQPIVVEMGQQQPWGGENENASGNTGVSSVSTIDDGRTPQVPNGASSPWAWMVGSVDGESGVGVGGMWDGVMAGLLFGLVTVWFVWGKRWFGGKKKRPPSFAGEAEETKVGSVERESAAIKVNGDATALVEEAEVTKDPPILVNGNGKQLSIDFSSTPNLNLTKPLPDVPPPLTAGVDNDEGDDSDENGLPTTPGKRKARRGKRGRKKKASGDKEAEKEEGGLVLTPKLPVVSQPSLVVSETILGVLVLVF